MDIELIAAGAAGLLAAQAAGSFASEAGKSAWAVTNRLARLLWSKSERDSQLHTAIERVQAEPNNQLHVAHLARNIERLAANDDDFLPDLAAIMIEARDDPAVGSILVSGNARVGKISTFRDVHGDVQF
jgi:hypothetical protein